MLVMTVPLGGFILLTAMKSCRLLAAPRFHGLPTKNIKQWAIS
ncbi:hypothetical protein ACFFL1_14635 [Samsonia erythrinae]|nr:hypothetical protein [Samsonia erythrinae]